MASTEEKLLTLLLSVEHLQHTAMEQQKAVADSLAVARETLRGYRDISDGNDVPKCIWVLKLPDGLMMPSVMTSCKNGLNRTITAILNRREWSGMTSGNGWIHRLSNMNWSEGCNMMLRGSMALT
ncbi:hypothetical protein GKG14_24005 [Escherichia coli]|nr:hypothetical protein [Escherichia coli]